RAGLRGPRSPDGRAVRIVGRTDPGGAAGSVAEAVAGAQVHRVVRDPRHRGGDLSGAEDPHSVKGTRDDKVDRGQWPCLSATSDSKQGDRSISGTPSRSLLIRVPTRAGRKCSRRRKWRAMRSFRTRLCGFVLVSALLVLWELTVRFGIVSTVGFP